MTRCGRISRRLLVVSTSSPPTSTRLIVGGDPWKRCSSYPAIDDKLASAPWLGDRQLISQLPGVQPGAPDLSNMRGVSRHLRHVSWRIMSGVMTPRDGEMLHMVTASHAPWQREADNLRCAIKPLMINTCRIAGLLKTKVAIFVFWDNSLLGDKINSEVTPDKLVCGYTEGTGQWCSLWLLTFTCPSMVIPAKEMKIF